jgi:hypothetical protein
MSARVTLAASSSISREIVLRQANHTISGNSAIDSSATG